jgi:hypothetical protein
MGNVFDDIVLSFTQIQLDSDPGFIFSAVAREIEAFTL